jgi:hypothetical protein
VSCPAPCKAGRLSNHVLQDAGQDEKNRPATFSGIDVFKTELEVMHFFESVDMSIPLLFVDDYR